MRYLPLLLLFASCASSRPTELIRYKAMRCDCVPDIAMSYRVTKCDTGSVRVQTRNIINRNSRYVKVQDGFCTTIYAL